MRVVGAGVAAVAVVCATVSGCSFNFSVGGEPTVFKDALQDDIANRLTEAGEKPESVTCATDLEGEVGKTTRCEVVLSPKNSFEPIVTVTEVDGSTVSYEMTPALSKEQLENSVSDLVADSSGLEVNSVSCESGLEGEEGAIAHCVVDAGGLTLTRTVEVEEVDGLLMDINVVPILTKREVASALMDELTPQIGERPDAAKCDDNLEGSPGNTVTCTIVAGPDTQDFLVTVTTVDGDSIDYRYEPID